MTPPENAAKRERDLEHHIRDLNAPVVGHVRHPHRLAGDPMTTRTTAPRREDDDANVICDVCDKPITTGKIVVAGGDERDIYMHERCVQP